MGQTIGSIVKAALLIGLIYALLNWQGLGLLEDNVKDFAEEACVIEIEQRFSVSRVNVYAINENSNGYTVRASVTLTKGGNAKVNCLTNPHGGVKDITIEER
jgi:hypothetical protein